MVTRILIFFCMAFALCILIILLISYFKERNRVKYVINIIMLNTAGEILLVYNLDNKNLDIIKKEVPFDQIPTRLINKTIYDNCFLEVNDFVICNKIHHQTNKYARVRDDIGPALIVDNICNKQCNLFYVFIVNEDIVLKKQSFPYPDFFSIKEIESMDEDTKPSIMSIDLIQKIVHILIEDKNEK